MKRLVWRGVATILVALLYGWINLLLERDRIGLHILPP
jgi:hypothetical protein